MQPEMRSTHTHWHDTVKLFIAFISALSVCVGGLFWLFKTSLPSAEATQALKATTILQMADEEKSQQIKELTGNIKDLVVQFRNLDIKGQLSQIQADQESLQQNQAVFLGMLQKQSERMDRVFELAAEGSRK